MKTRREFMVNSANAALTAGALGVATDTRVAHSQEAQVSSPIDLSNGGQVTQIMMVVRNAEETAHGFSEVFGPSWDFYEFKPQNVVLRDGAAASSDCALRIAVGTCGGYTFKLIQPVSGPTPHAKFLERNGEGFFGIGIGAMRNYDAVVKALAGAAVPVAMQGEVGDGSSFTILDTAQDLGLRVEFGSMAKQESSPHLRKVGSYTPHVASIFDMTIPMMQGGRRFAQLGLVVKDMKGIAQRYGQILGIKNWHFTSIGATDDVLRGTPMQEKDWPSATVGQGVAYIGGMQVELLEPVAEGPGGIHRQFLDRHWPDNGFQHLMISPSSGDLVPTIAKLQAKGIGFEWIASVHFADRPNFLPPYQPGTPRGGYVDLEKLVGGFVLEWGG